MNAEELNSKSDLIWPKNGTFLFGLSWTRNVLSVTQKADGQDNKVPPILPALQ